MPPSPPRRHYVTGNLVAAALLIRVMLKNLDDIGLASHRGPTMRERVADDFMMVYANVLPKVDAPEPLLALLRLTLVDWVNLDSLMRLDETTVMHDAASDAMEELATRIASNISVARERWLFLFEFEIETE